MENKACPFCGNEDDFVIMPGGTKWYIKCWVCKVQIPGDTKEEAAKAWNTRPSPWVKISKRLPEKLKDSNRSIDCLVIADGIYEKHIEKAYYNYSNKKWWICGTNEYFSIAIAWQPLPPIPEDL